MNKTQTNPEMDKMPEFERLRVWIRTRGLTQTKFARRCGVTFVYMNEILRGRRPGLKMAVEIHRQTGGAISATKLLGLEN
jgi:transcriptional regulator with XRE-family HTH domain